MAAACLAFLVFLPEKDLNSLNLLSNIWLIKIFKIQAGIIVNQVSLSGINWLDILILLLFILTCLSLFERARYSYKVWFLIACTLLILGIIVFNITKLAGRSSFMDHTGMDKDGHPVCSPKILSPIQKANGKISC